MKKQWIKPDVKLLKVNSGTNVSPNEFTSTGPAS